MTPLHLSIRECDHRLGYASITLKQKDGEIIGRFLYPIHAINAGWQGDGLVTLFWEGAHFKYCPDCGIALGETRAVGMRPPIETFQIPEREIKRG